MNTELILEIGIFIAATVMTALCLWVTSKNHPERIEEIRKNWAPVAQTHDGD